MKNPVIYYHLWREGDWKNITKKIFETIVSSGLSEHIEAINICVNDNRPVEDIELFGLDESKVSIRRINDTRTEWPTLEALYEDNFRESDIPILYLHSKGASYKDDDPRKKAVESWVDGLLYYVVEEWRKCLSTLRLGGISVGANKRNDPSVHFSGNFWWIMSDAIKALPNPKMQNQTFDNRYGAELWIGALGSINLKNNGLVGFNYNKVIPRSAYFKNQKVDVHYKNICLHVDNNMNLNAFDESRLPFEMYRNGFNSYAISYLDYIINNYESLPDYTYFVRTSQLVQHCPNLFDYVEKGDPKPFEFISRNILECNSLGEPHHPGLPLQRFWDAIYSEYSCPEKFTFGAGGQFVVSRDLILSNSLDFYVTVRSLISTRINPIEDNVLERLWGNIFGEKGAPSFDFDFQVFIFNYGLMNKALALQKQFTDIGIDAYILDSDSGNEVPEGNNIYAFENIYYSGLWNEALELFTGSHMMIITSDVEIPDASKLVKNAKAFYKSDKAWIYAPNVNYTFWDYEPSALADYSRDLKIVPNTDGMCWALSSDAAFSVGNIDIEINKIGFGIDLLAAMMAGREGKLVVRDYSITVKHPQTRSYDSKEAEKQEFAWIDSIGYIREYIQYRNHYSMSFLR